MSIRVENITKYYGEQKAVDSVSFTINTGEVVGFLGPNGAGKSTLMKIINGFLPPSEGSVFINGLDISEHPVEIKRMIGYLPENNPLYPDMYITEYLKFIAGIYKLGSKTGDSIDRVVEMTGLEPELHKKIGQLSKGYRQRVGLAQALIHDPGILILDEPTSGLDPNQLIDIRRLIAQAGVEKTVMLSTHIMQEVEAVAGRVIIIDKGRIKADDSREGIYSRAGTQVSTVMVEFDREPSREKLEGISGAGAVKEISEVQYLIEASGEEDIRPAIFRFAVDNGLAVLSMQRQERSLEEVFRRVTSEK